MWAMFSSLSSTFLVCQFGSLDNTVLRAYTVELPSNNKILYDCNLKLQGLKLNSYIHVLGICSHGKRISIV